MFCWGFAGWSLSKALTKLGLVALTNKRASKSITDGTEKALAEEVSSVVLGCKPGPDQPSWVAWERGSEVERPKTFDDPELHH